MIDVEHISGLLHHLSVTSTQEQRKIRLQLSAHLTMYRDILQLLQAYKRTQNPNKSPTANIDTTELVLACRLLGVSSTEATGKYKSILQFNINTRMCWLQSEISLLSMCGSERNWWTQYFSSCIRYAYMKTSHFVLFLCNLKLNYFWCTENLSCATMVFVVDDMPYQSMLKLMRYLL